MIRSLTRIYLLLDIDNIDIRIGKKCGVKGRTSSKKYTTVKRIRDVKGKVLRRPRVGGSLGVAQREK